MKDQLIEKLHELLKAEEVTTIRESVREIRMDWKAESAKEKQLQEEAFKAATPENSEEEQSQSTDATETEVATETIALPEFVYVPHELEGKFQELIATYENRVEEHGKKLAAERQKNLELRQDVLKEMEALVKDEQNIGKAFGAHKLLKEKWDTAGDVPGNTYHDLNDKWQKLNHEFFYNINIYKSLQEHDLKINQKKKEELIAEAKALASIESITDLEVFVRKYQREWTDIGPSPRETYREMGDAFFGVLREATTRIQAHYDALHANSEENLAKKKALVDKMKDILGMEITNQSTWNRWTDEVMKLQEEWRGTGWANKKQNEEVWQEFRGLCDLFFGKRNAFYDEKRVGFKENKEKKEALISKAQELQHSEDWKATADAIKKLQEQWKAVGPADSKDEQKLWQKFRSFCDHFFQKRKEIFEAQGSQQEENYRLKSDLLVELEALEMTGNKGTDINALKEFSDRWHAIGFVPREKVKEVMDKYNQLLDVKYGKLNADREHREMETFRSRLSNIKSGQDGDFKLKKEKSFMREKIERLKQDIKQYENNMGIFTGKGAEAFRAEIEKKIKNAQREIEDIKKKMELLDA